MFDPLIGDKAFIAARRALDDLRAGLPILFAGREPRLALAVEALTDARLAELRRIAGGAVSLAVSGTRAAALGLPAKPTAIALDGACDLARVQALANGAPARLRAPAQASDAAAAAVTLAKLALLLPAVVIAPLAADSGDAFAELARVTPEDVLALPAACVASMQAVSRARVPLRPDIDSEFVIFRDALGRTMTAVLVGAPDASQPVPVRLHSACLTGDVFGSLRCDCGDQLRMSLDILQQRGGGVLLYLDQEGCGIGLANKMRAYGLQDRGLDTIDANTALGFASDERRYDAAARMLTLLGIGRVLLLTNNPAKLAGLGDHGIDIAGRIPLLAPVHSANMRYLHAKAHRAGHMLEDVDEPAAALRPTA